MKKVLLIVISIAVAFGLNPCLHAMPTSSIGQHMQKVETDKKKKEKELQNLEALKEIVANEIAVNKAEMAQNMSNTVQQVGKSKSDPNGLVTTAGGIVHGPSQHWVLDVKKLRKEYEQAGIYTASEIDVIVGYHEAYVQNQGFTGGIAEQLAKIAEATAQKRTIEKYIDRKKKEIRELDNTLRGSSAASGNGDGGGGGGGGGNGGGY